MALIVSMVGTTMAVVLKKLFLSFIEVNMNISKLELLEISGFLLQGLQLVNNSAEFFSFTSSLTVGPGSVCAIVFLDRNAYPVAASSPLR